MTLNIHLEPLTSILRVYDEGKSYGDEYLWCCTVRYVNIEEVELCGVTNFKMEYKTPIIKAFGLYGIKRLFFYRKLNGSTRRVDINIEAKVNRMLNQIKP